MSVDEFDEKILSILEDDARASIGDIAKMVDLGESEVEKRISALQKANIIRKFKTSIDWKKAGKTRSSAIIQVKVVPQRRAGFSKVCQDIARDSRVKDLYVASGEYDMVLFVEAANIDEVSEFVTEKLAPKKEVVGTYTHIVLRGYKRDGVLAFDEKPKRLKISI